MRRSSNSSNTPTRILENLLQLILSILESLLTSSGSGNGKGRGGLPGSSREEQQRSSSSSSSSFFGSDETNKKLTDAFHLFGSNLNEAKKSPEEARSKIKKNFRKLSLTYHPDRNNGSEESKLKMQQINADYALCCDHLDVLEGNVAEEEEVEDEVDKEQEQPSASQPQKRGSKKQQQRSSYNKKKGSNKKKNRRTSFYHDDDDEDNNDGDAESRHRHFEKTMREHRQQVQREQARLQREEQERMRQQRQSEGNNIPSSNSSGSFHQHGTNAKKRRKSGKNKAQNSSTSSTTSTNNTMVAAQTLDQQHDKWMRSCNKIQRKKQDENGQPQGDDEEEDSVDESPPPSEDIPTSSSSGTTGSSMHDIDDDEDEDEDEDDDENDNKNDHGDGIGDSAEPSKKKIRKPKHNTLERCSDPLAIAVRLGHVEVFYDLLMEKVMKLCVEHLVEQDLAQMRGKSIVGNPQDITQELMEDCFLKSLLLPLDGDDNTILHYICYYETSEMLSVILMYVGANYETLVLQENARGQVPADFCHLAFAKDEAFHERIQVATETARRAREERKIGTRAWKILSSMHALQIVYSVLALLFGTRLFQHSILSSLIIVVVIQYFQKSLELIYSLAGGDGMGDPAKLILFAHLFWSVLPRTLLFAWCLCYWWVCLCVAISMCYLGSSGIVAAAQGMFLLVVFAAALLSRLLRCAMHVLVLPRHVSRLAGSNAALRNLMQLAFYALLVWVAQDFLWPLIAGGFARFASFFIGASTSTLLVGDTSYPTEGLGIPDTPAAPVPPVSIVKSSINSELDRAKKIFDEFALEDLDEPEDEIEFEIKFDEH